MPKPMTVLGLALLCSGCVTSVMPLSDNFADESRTDAIELTIDRLEAVYSFTEHKQLDWSSVRARLQSELERGEGDDDYDRVLRKLTLAIPDGHVILWNDEDEARNLCPEAEGVLGVTFAETDDGVIVVRVDDAVEDVQPGDQLVRWRGLAVEDALAAMPLHCYPIGLATNARRRAGRVRLLGAAEAGAMVELELSRDTDTVAVTLDAVADGRGVRERLGIEPPLERSATRMLSEDIGYLKLGWEATLSSEWDVRRGLKKLHADGARALVFDLRDNDGGTDQTAANIVGMFSDERRFYETITMYDRRIEGQRVISELWIEPQEVLWDLPTVVLINGNTVSSGEGISMMLEPLEHVTIVGFEGTAASFGSSGSTTKLPDGWSLVWPAGRGLDADGNIMLDSDETFEGGVLPNHIIPWTAEHRIAQAADSDFEIDYAMQLLQEAP